MDDLLADVSLTQQLYEVWRAYTPYALSRSALVDGWVGWPVGLSCSGSFGSITFWLE
jgi:hypothetical protein